MAAPLDHASGRVQVEMIEQRLLQPSRPSPQPWLFLAPCDVLLRPINYTRRVLFFRRPDIDMPYALLLRRLQSSLAEALAHFYPLAGRLGLRDGQLAVRCNDEGAEFVQAALRGDVQLLRKMERGDFPMQPFYAELARWGSYAASRHEGSAPLLSLQVTRFPCGGIALGVALSHVIADGTSFWHFMSSWVECARGKLPSLLPLHSRTLLGAHDRSAPHGLQYNAAVTDFFETLNDDHEGRPDDEQQKQKAFSFSREMVDKLKAVAKRQYSSYEVMSAHIWKRTNGAWQYPRDTRVGFINVVNMRERVDPPLPKGYFGNAVLWSISIATVGELQDEDLSNTAARIHDAVLACSDSRMQDFLRLLNVRSCSSDKILRPLNCNGVRMRVSSSTKFPVFRINFGWGTPLAARSAAVEETNKLAFYPGSHGPGSIDICLALPTRVMERLEADNCFLDGEYT